MTKNLWPIYLKSDTVAQFLFYNALNKEIKQLFERKTSS